MADYSVDVGLNVNADQYITTIGQAVAVTEQYSNVAGGIGNVVNGVSQGLIGLTRSLTGFNAVNNIAVDTAAQYQKAMSGIEAKAVSAGKSFTQLEKTTKQFARNFPGGMGQAVQVMGTMQQMGVRTEKQMESLGKSWIKLGAATGTNAAAMGQEFTQLSRIMGNGLSSFDKMSDSLTTVTAKIGGSAESVVAFSKVMAPIAATVGASQTAVLGLSSAMSSIGEDGARSAMVFQKVWLDMNRAIRDGGPELKAYAELLGTTGDNLKKMFSSNPTEMLLKFTEAIGKSSGPEVTRTLEGLGFDSVRDTRALTALARSGKAREAVETAQAAYGNGSMGRAAEIANKGLSDQAMMLKESSQQIVANIGKPLLAVAEGQLNIANAVAGKLNDILESEPAQNANKVTGLGSLAFQAIGGVAGLATLISFAKIGRNALGRSEFGQGVREQFRYARNPDDVNVPGEAGNQRRFLGQQIGGTLASLIYPVGQPTSLAERAKAGSVEMYRFGKDLTARGITGAYTNVFRAGDDRPPIRTESGMQFRETFREAMQAFRTGDMAGGWGTLGRGTRQYVGDIGDPNKAMPLGRSLARAGYGAAATVAGAAGSIAGGIGSVLGTFISPQMLAVGGGLALGSYISGKQQDQDRYRDALAEGNKDIYRFYNDFAAATGQASKGIVEFGAAVKQTTSQVVEQNTSMSSAMQLSKKEMQAASSSGYNPALKFVGSDKSADALALQARMVLGGNPSAKELGQLSLDLYNQTKNQDLTQEVLNRLGSFAPGGKTRGIPTGALIEAFNSQGDWTGFTNEVQGTLSAQASAAIQQQGYEAGQLYGGSIEGNGVSVGADRATVLLEAKALYEDALKNTTTISGSNTASQTLANLLYPNQPEKAQEVGLGTGFFDQTRFGKNIPGVTGRLLRGTADQSFEAFLNNPGNEELKKEYDALMASGVTRNSDGTLNYSKQMITKKSDNQIETEQYLAQASKATAGTNGLSKALGEMSKSLFSTTEAARDLAKPLGQVTNADSIRYGGTAAMNEFRQDQSSSTKRQAAVDELIQGIIKTTGGNFSQAKLALGVGGAVAREGSADQEAYRAALQQLDVYQSLANAGKTQTEVLREQVNAGRQAQQMPSLNGQTQEVRTSTILGGISANAGLLSGQIDLNRAYGALMTGMAQADRSAGVSMGSVSRDAAMKTRYAREDYQMSRRYAREDYETSRFRSERDFGRQMQNAQRDFGRSS